MADIRAAQSGDFSATSTWVGGVVPGSGDIAYANTFTVTISDTRTVQAISNASGTSITVGGTFSLLSGCSLTCTNANGVVQGATATSCVTTPSLTLGTTAAVAANCTALATGNSVTFSTAGTLNWTGNTTGSNNNSIRCINITGSGAYNQTGNALSGSGGNGAHAILISGAATVTITGNVTGGPGGNTEAILLSNSSCSCTVTGTVTGGSASTSYGITNSAGTLTVNGTCVAGAGSTGAPAIGPGSGTQITRLSGPFLLGSGNINPVVALAWRWAPTQIPTYMEVPVSSGATKRNLYTADNMPSGGYPVAANVRQSTVYGPNSEFTGTLSVPAASSVALGVATDNTTGTAILTAANVRTAMGLASANLDTQLATAAADSSGVTTLLDRLTSGRAANLDNLNATVPSAAAIASQVRTELTTELARIDAPISALPSAAAIAAAVWSAASRTLTTAIDNSSTIAAAVWSAATRTLTSGGGTAPTAAENASAVWSAATRTLTSSSAPSAATVATAVRTELTPELARISNCATVDTTATTIQDALEAP